MTMTPEQRNHMIGHAAWLAHEASGCGCGMDNPPITEVERVKAALPHLEEKIRADERERIAAWLRSLKSNHGIIGIQLAAQMIEEDKIS